MELAQPISALSRRGKAFFKVGRGDTEHFSSWMLNDELNLTVLERGVDTFSRSREGGARQNYSPKPIPRSFNLRIPLPGPLYSEIM